MLTIALLAGFVASVIAQDQHNNLTPDGYWHNRKFHNFLNDTLNNHRIDHALLSMAAYGPENSTCPVTTFTEESKDRSFPNSPYPAWDMLGTFGPTASGCAGSFLIIPEMNKALISFVNFSMQQCKQELTRNQRGNYELEQTLPDDVVGWDYFGMGEACPACTVNRFAAQGYMECKQETNNFEVIRNAYYGQGLVFSITGHGLGGMHSLIASVDLNHQNIAYYSHNYGTPRTFNTVGASWFNYNFNGEAGERGISQNDMYTEYIPAGPNYAHAGTPFYYYGFNSTSLGMNWHICWDGANNDGPIYDDPRCSPRPNRGSTALQDHYFYFTNVGQCGSQTDPTQYTQQTWIADAFVANATAQEQYLSLSSASAVSASSAYLASEASASASSVSVERAMEATAKPTGVQQATSSAASICFSPKFLTLALFLAVLL